VAIRPSERGLDHPVVAENTDYAAIMTGGEGAALAAFDDGG
jgi:hypothetical protein